MNRIILTLTVVVAGMAVDVFGQDEQVRDDGVAALKHGWVLNFDEAKRQARKTNRPLMVVFRCIP
jgi:hypothetical protein